MQSSFNYLYQTLSQDTLTVEDIGNVCLEACNDLGQHWILLIKTKLGFSYIIEYGPYHYNKITEYLNSNFQRIEYSEYKLQKRIDKFLNEPKRIITQVRFINEDEALEVIQSAVEVLNESYQ